MKKFLTTVLSVLTIASSALTGSAAAAGSASLSMSPSGGSYNVGTTISVTISENSGADSVNTIQADYTYDASKLQFLSAACNGSFEIGASANASGITCGTTTPKTGSQVVGSVNFKAIAAGTATASFSGSSHIYTTTQADVWNGAATGASFAITTPAPVTPTIVPVTGSSKIGTNGGSTVSSATNPVTPTEPTPVVAGTVESASIKMYTVTIKVEDTRGNTLSNVTVVFNGNTMQTNASGRASFAGVKAGTYDVKATSGKVSTTNRVTVNSRNKTTQKFIVEVPVARHSRFGFFGTGAAMLIIGGGLIASRRKRPGAVQPANKKTEKAAPRLATAKR